MNKEMIISRIIDDGPSEPLLDACVRLVEYLYSYDDIAHLSFTRLARIIESEDSLLLLQMTQYLAGAGVQLLDVRFELIVDDEVFDLDSEYLEDARLTNKLMHPEAGVEVVDYESKVYPYFVPSQTVLEGRQK